MDFSPEGKAIVVNAEQVLKALSPISFNVSPKVTEARLEQPLKQSLGIEVRCDGNTTESRAEFWNEPAPSDVSVEGKITDSRPEL